jgi:hypothetical protein
MKQSGFSKSTTAYDMKKDGSEYLSFFVSLAG